jgi:2'-5' RNA ligase
MRLFTALDLPADVAQNVEELLVRLRPKVRIQWTPVSNLHITTKFIGEWPEQRLPEMRTALATLPERPAIPIQIRQVGFFPNPHSPRVFNLGVHAPQL